MTAVAETIMPEVGMPQQVASEALPGAELAAEVAALARDVQATLYERGVVYTPLEDFSEFAPDNVTLLVKNEGEQHTGAFKIRGATAALCLASRAAAERGEVITSVVTASDGNHGLGVKAAADHQDLPCIVEMAAAISPGRKERLRQAGAVVYGHHPTFEAANAAAIQRSQADPGCLYIDPFDAVETMAGQASMAREVLHDLFERHAAGEIDMQNDEIVLVAAMAGGGMAASFASVLEEARSQGLIGGNITLIGAQLEHSDAFARTWYGEEPLTEETLDGSCESTALLAGGKLTHAILEQAACFDGIVRVTRAETGEAMLCMRERYGLTEPAGALGLAVALKLARRETPHHGNGKGRVFVTVRCGSDQLTPEEFQAYADEVDESVLQSFAARAEHLRQKKQLRVFQSELADYQAAVRRARQNNQSPGRERKRQSTRDGDGDLPRRVGVTACWSGPTHAFATGLVEPTPTSRSWR